MYDTSYYNMILGSVQKRGILMKRPRIVSEMMSDVKFGGALRYPKIQIFKPSGLVAWSHGVCHDELRRPQPSSWG